jgi:thiol-disulfide isomerase/thioredoxin
MSHAAPRARARTPLCVLLAYAAAAARIVDLRPESWGSSVVDRDYLVYFTVQGCKHCEKLTPMMQYVADTAPDLRVGRVDATAHNGVARTFGLQKFPSIVRFDAQGVVYEYVARQRTPDQLIAFARGDHRYGSAGTVAPRELLPDVSEWWMLLEAMWPPIRTSLTWAIGVALALKGIAKGCLMLLRRNEPRGGELKGKKREGDDGDAAGKGQLKKDN